MKRQKYFYILLSLLYFELIFHLFMYESYLRSSIINIILFSIINSFIVYLFTSVWSEKLNKIFTYITYSILGFWYSLHFVFSNLLESPFSLSMFALSDQAATYSKNVIIGIFENIHMLILFFAPLILYIIFRRKIFNKRIVKKDIFVPTLILCFVLVGYIANIFLQKRESGNIYNLYFETNNVSLNLERLGVMAATMLDVNRTIFGFEEKIVDVTIETNGEDELFKYDYNNLDINLDKGTGNIKKINDYIKTEEGTRQNKYTGMFEGMNLVFVVAESFSEIAVSEELTPTLYKLTHEGFDFKNFYTSNNQSTIGGEFQALTGLYADNSILSTWRSGSRYFPYGIGTMFANKGYNVYGYHNNSAYFQDRNVYLKSQGIKNFKGCYNGMEKLINCETWPQSDVDMINATYKDYVNKDEPFLAYYMTVSGHFYYTFSENYAARKNKKYVNHLDYNEHIKAYLATQIELDRALESLMKKLDEAGKLDNTVIVLLADHYPYYLNINDINKLSTYKRDKMIEVNSNSLIIYNSRMKGEVIDKVGMSIDVLPTVLNLFGMEYDSRIIMGKDILSTSLGIAIFKDKSWVTDKGTYYASSGKFVGEEVDSDYVKNINNIVNNRVAVSRMIVANDYYRKIK